VEQTLVRKSVISVDPFGRLMLNGKEEADLVRTKVASLHPDAEPRFAQLIEQVRIEVSAMAEEYEAMRSTANAILQRPPWEKILIGTHSSSKMLMEETKRIGREVNIHCMNDHDQISVTSNPREIELFVVSPADLGFKKLTSVGRIYERARFLGFGLCPAEVGLQFVFQCTRFVDFRDDYYIAMTPFYLGNWSIAFHIQTGECDPSDCTLKRGRYCDAHLIFTRLTSEENYCL